MTFSWAVGGFCGEVHEDAGHVDGEGLGEVLA